jgi:adenine-specific DNA-methyltransferase
VEVATLMLMPEKLERVARPLLVDRVDLRRIEASRRLRPARRSELGQFMTPKSVATFMASLFGPLPESARVLDAGAGVGSLVAAFAAEACSRTRRPKTIDATAFELDPPLASHLRTTLEECRDACSRFDVRFTASVVEGDFIEVASQKLDGGLFSRRDRTSFTHAILNPPYKKLHAASAARKALRRVGIETSNLYTAFLGLAILLLEPDGELVAITPRSFCNGPYFRPFRELFVREMALLRIHVFDSRSSAFADDEVLQENVIFHAVKAGRRVKVMVSSSSGPDDVLLSVRRVAPRDVVRPEDPELFIHVVPDDSGGKVAEVVAALPSRLSDIDLAVSTGRVVDFRVRAYLRPDPDDTSGPLIYPTHFSEGVVRWPKPGKKPNALLLVPETSALWMPAGVYVLVKRFSSKEERRRVVAALLDPKLVAGAKIGFENHLNVFHRGGRGLPLVLARGLVAFLNATLVDTYFRQFNGHTQVNATDLRNLRYPSLEAMTALGERVRDLSIPQEALDAIVREVLGFAFDVLGPSSR